MSGSEQMVIEVSSDAGISRLPARGEVITIGRSTDNDVVLNDDQTVSRQHAELVRHDGAWAIRDLASQNGTHLNGVKVAPNEVHPVGVTDVLGVGAATIRIVAVVDPGLTVEDSSGSAMHLLLTALSAREQEVLAAVAGGLTDDQVAKHLFISVKTVHSHLDRIRDKTGVRRRAELTRLAVRLGLSSPSSGSQ